MTIKALVSVFMLPLLIHCVQEENGKRLFDVKTKQDVKVSEVNEREKDLFKQLPTMKKNGMSLDMLTYFIMWREFKQNYTKTYENFAEEKKRFSIFIDNYEKVAKHNALFDAGLSTFHMKLNKFSDMDHQEFVKTMNGYKSERLDPKRQSSTYLSPSNIRIPTELDWRNFGYVTDMKNQTGALEGQQFRKTKKLVSLSEQNLIDCSSNWGCEGGLPYYAFKYVEHNGGIDTEACYSYEAKISPNNLFHENNQNVTEVLFQDGKCRFKRSCVGATVTGIVDLPKGDEISLVEALGTVGPISVAIDASHESFQHYDFGLYYEPECSSSKLDHAVLLVGYGDDDANKEYWTIKNSWGETWGVGGYMDMIRNMNNHCGIATQASYPLV